MKTSELLEKLATEAQIGDRNPLITMSYQHISLQQSFIRSMVEAIDNVYPNLMPKSIQVIRRQAEEFIT